MATNTITTCAGCGESGAERCICARLKSVEAVVNRIVRELEMAQARASQRETEAGRAGEWSKAARWSLEAHALGKFQDEVRRIIKEAA